MSSTPAAVPYAITRTPVGRSLVTFASILPTPIRQARQRRAQPQDREARAGGPRNVRGRCAYRGLGGTQHVDGTDPGGRTPGERTRGSRRGGRRRDRVP